MLLIAVQTFHDAQADTLRAVGDRFECGADRASELIGYGLATASAEQPKPKRAPRRKAAGKE